MTFTVLGYTYSIYGILTVIALFIILILISISDIRTQKISLFYVLAVFALGIVSIWTIPGIKLYERFIGMVCVSVPLFLINFLVNKFKRKSSATDKAHPDSADSGNAYSDNANDNIKVFGGGDIKLLAAAGFMLGWKGIIVAFMLAMLTGGVFAIFLYFSKKKKKTDVFAFAPFLAMGIAVSITANMGTRFINWIIMMVKTIADAMVI